jgi:signal transduction histidine kinase
VEFLDIMQDSAQQMLKIVNSILDSTNLKAAQHLFKVSKFDLRENIEAAMSLVGVTAVTTV